MPSPLPHVAPRGARPAAPLPVIVLALLAVACGDATNPTPDTRPEPAPRVAIGSVAVVEGDTQTGVVGEVLERPLVALVADSAGRPIAGRTVRFDVRREGRWDFASAKTDAAGRASMPWRLDVLAGTQRAFVVVFDSVSLRTLRDSATATASPGPPARVVPTQGFAAAGEVATPLAPLLAVGIADAYGNRVAGAANVVWAPGSGRLEDAETTADSTGIARARWVLGDTAGEQRISVSLVGGPTFTHVVAAAAGPPVRGAVDDGWTEFVVPRGDRRMHATARYFDRFGNRSMQGSTWRIRDAGLATANSEYFHAVAAGSTQALGMIANTVLLEIPLVVPATISAAGALVASEAGELFWHAAADNREPGSVTVAPYRRVVGLPPIASVASGPGGNECALARDGTAYCWGYGDFGQHGTGGAAGLTPTTPVGSVHAPVAGQKFASIAVGHAGICGIGLDARAYCWGIHRLGTVDGSLRVDCDRDVACSRTPFAVHATRRFRSIDASWSHFCAIAEDGVALCWGSNGAGQLGTTAAPDRCTEPGTPDPYACSHAPIPVETDVRFVEVALDGVQSCARTSDGAVWCWGMGGFGVPGVYGSPTPRRVVGIPPVAALYPDRACGITADGAVWCWRNGSEAPSALPFRARLHGSGGGCLVSEDRLVRCPW